jgi:hypothetical protein
MTTLATFRTHLQDIISDTLDTAILDEWLGEAILDYSNYFPYVTSALVACVTDQVDYALTGVSLTDVRSLVEVRYPYDDDPPRFITRLPLRNPAFQGGPYYDVRMIVQVPTLTLGETPTTGQRIFIRYNTRWPVPTQDSEELAIPEEHEYLLNLFIQWQAIKQLEFAESYDPDVTTLMLTSFGLNATRAERVYRTRIEDAVDHSAPGGYGGSWKMDQNDRIY